ncbi:SusC/RagA family TonB-linked outer membrane protein [Sunxiuqinia elliptica]|uniref:TonB-linked outer membrane protein, SusC/RagA family n=1 Tax=Sunxiuqinia elliptica TaxID=655355 RepID=A0A1I2GUQ6_9BACT|nr:SusC/RagA family TonB-linked outer membrane protein [Sunxiuqinia elliptica]SFF20870.1 TonB-linked outer membrane protein, SusC/RagA family [Sunxiuqinia elliptica]
MKKMTKWALLFSLLFWSGIGLTHAQQKTINGTVTDNDKNPLPGVNVVEKSTMNGVITDVDGHYSLAVSSGKATLVFSFIGMTAEEVNVGDKTTINVMMEPDVIGLEEVVAIGYGSSKKQAVTGSVSKANLEAYREVPVNNVLETVKGIVPGLNVGGTNRAGQVAGLSVRGQNSTGGNSPLIVLDGAIYGGSIGDISSDDIESLTVLKDASAAAVYGSRSANGVILIETKSGRGINGKPKFDIKLSYGISNELERLEVYDADGYIQRLLDIRAANGLETDPNNIPLYLQDEEQKNYEATPDHRPTLTDPYEMFRQNAYNVRANVSVSNSTENSSYYISATMTDQKGVVLNDSYKNFTGRVNISSDLTDWFNLGVKSSYSVRDFSGDSPSIYRATHFSPWATVFNEDGSYKQFPQTTTSFNSPFWEIATVDHDLQNNLNGIVTGKISVPGVKGLSYTINYSNSLRWNERNYFYNENTINGKGKNGIGQRSYSRSVSTLFDNIVKYNRTFAEKHNVDVTLLYSREKYVYESMAAYAEDFDNTILLDYKLEDGKTQTASTGGGESFAIGQMARATYTFNNKYSLTGTVRRDGYSAFSKNNKWGIFSSAGFNWNISKEHFIENIDAINDLALRVSYGSNGNQSIGLYQTLAKVGTSKYLFAGDPSYTVTQSISSFALNDLGWETTTGLNLGLDFGIINHRINGSVDLYKTKTSDLLFPLSLPRASGKSSITSNLGEIQNRGIEINLHTLNLQKQDFEWTSDFAFSLNRNKVATIYGEDNDGDGIEDDLISSGYFIGEPLGTIYTYKVIGIYQQEDMDNGTIMDGMRPGDYKLEDINEDGKITSDQDRQFLGTSKENFRWSWTNTFRYKNFSLMAYLYSIWGGNGYFLSGNNTPYYDGYANRADLNHPVYDYWTPTNTGAMFPRPDYSSNAAYRGTKYFDRSFIKLQKVSLSYNLTDMVKPWGIQGMRATVSADNLFTYAPHWEGLDPETGQGLTDSATPSIRTYLFSLSFNF